MRFSDLVQLGGLDPARLPRLQGYEDNSGRSNYCTCGLMGLCQFDDRTCYFRRVEFRDVSNEFANEYCRVIGPVMERYNRAMLQRRGGDNNGGGANNGTANRNQAGGGNDNGENRYGGGGERRVRFGRRY